MPQDALALARSEIGQRIAELHERAPRLAQPDLYARIDAIREIAARNGLAALEGLAQRSSQLALLPGHRTATRSFLEHVRDALDSSSPSDRTTILAALAVRLH